MPAYITKEKIQDIMTQYGGRPENTGSVEAQIALLPSESINYKSI